MRKLNLKIPDQHTYFVVGDTRQSGAGLMGVMPSKPSDLIFAVVGWSPRAFTDDEEAIRGATPIAMQVDQAFIPHSPAVEIIMPGTLFTTPESALKQACIVWTVYQEDLESETRKLLTTPPEDTYTHDAS